MSDEQMVSVSRDIDATPAEIFDILSHTEGHVAIDGSGTVRDDIEPKRLELGTKFGMKMKLGVPYRISSKVVEFEQDERIAWCHLGKHRWRYELEPIDGKTRVTETFDWSTAVVPKAIELMGYPDRHPESMARTLERLEAEVIARRDSE
ncbi:MAG: dimethyladenosine transferase [Acidimicrobiia bacterium]|nr:dimethyladenosine transferase [Acidimicrobiia bacterium]